MRGSDISLLLGQDNTNIFRFQDLVFDVQNYIITHLVSPTDLLALTLVCRHISSLATLALYSDVRLLLNKKPASGNTEVEGVSFATLTSSQHIFTRRVLTQQDYACHIRNLSWQVCGSGGRGGHTFTDLFPALNNLTHIHLVDPHPTHIAERASFLRPYPQSVTHIATLFPRVQHVKFTGTTSLSIVMPILHSPHRLTSLSLDTINPHSAALGLLKWIITSELPSLRTLSFRTLCQSRSARPCIESQERELLLAWRDALSAVRNTVELVTLGFRERMSSERNILSLPSVTRYAQFAQLVIPVFWEEQWPCLKSLQLEGGNIDGVSMALSATRLQEIVPKLVLDPTVCRVQHVWYSDIVEKF